ncbi:ABC transporter permease [Pseudohongiella spirulinae]|uniref:Permease n=1 Tax=Pseudohongiella spirulinae TaxID=1249552 RepID=A0A0S2KAV5_9GAMM|nr:FtsX-like permease family protein [Pseudohongiella spirulinae]ALO45219.1 permease [Pseudohongiella spirulinae]
MAESSVSNTQTLQPDTLLRIALRLLWRDWRGGELKLLLLAMIMAVTSVTGIALFTDRLQGALLQESANMLAADRVLSSRTQPPREWLQQATERGLDTAEFVSFASMVFSDQSNLLVSVKAVNDSYPLRGDLQVADQPFGVPYVNNDGPARGEVWVESRVLPALGLQIGDVLYVGDGEFTVSQVLVQEPDRQQGGMMESAGPRLLMHLEDVAATNVIQPGSRITYRYLFAGAQVDLDNFAQWLRDESDGQSRLRDVRDESQEVAEALSRAESFLMLGSLFAVILAGIAIALTARRYSERHFDYAAILKTLGCTSNQISAIYFTILALLLLIAVAMGSMFGWLVHELILRLLASVIPVQLPTPSLMPYGVGALTALVCLFAFAMPPLLALKHTSPLRVLRKDLVDAPLSTRLPYLFGIGGALLLIIWYSQDLLITGILVAGVAGVVLVLSALSWLLLRSGSAAGMRAGSAWMLAMSAVRRRRRQSVLQVLVFCLTIMSLLTLALLRTDLIRDWQAQLPEDTPNHFMMNITASQVDGMQNFMSQNNLQSNPFYPMMTAGLLSVNGEMPRNPWDEDDEQQTLTERSAGQDDRADAEAAEGGDEQGRQRVINRQVTWTSLLPPDNQIVAGSWWGEGDVAGQVSVEDDYARRLGVELGDELVFRAGEDQVTVTVTSLRTVRWDNMQPNFFFIFSPGTLDHLGATYLSTMLLVGEQKLMLNDLLRQFPTIVVLEVDAIIQQIQDIIAQVSSAIELIAALVLVAGALVLLACVNATLDERFRENAILRTLGAGRRLILNSLWIEFAFIGLLAGVIATVGAELSLYYLQTEVFQQDFSPHYWVWFVGPVAGTVIISLLGVNATRRVVKTSPLAVLRELSV